MREDEEMSAPTTTDPDQKEQAENSFATRRLKRVVIREELVVITGDFLEGLILGQMLYWTERVRHFDAFLKEEMQRTQQESKDTIEPLKGWFTKTAKQLNEELMLRMSAPTIRTKLKSLVEKHLLFERENPYQRRDRARQYRVSLLALANILDQNGYHLEGYPKIGNLECNKKFLASNLKNLECNKKFLASNLKNLGTISKINTEIKEHLSKDKCNGSDEPWIISPRDRYNVPVEEIEENSFIIVSIPRKEQESDGAEEAKTPSPILSLADRVRKNLPNTYSAARITKSEQLPPRETMPRCLQVWFTLPLVAKPSAKTYRRIVCLIRQLEHGRFPAQYKSLNIDFVERRKIRSEHLAKTWSDEELARLLDGDLRSMIEDGTCWPENKERYFKGLSFESFVLNKRTGRSWLLSLLLQPPQLLSKISTKQAFEQDPYPQCTYEIAEALEISRKLNPEEYAGIVRNFSQIVQFFRPLPVEEGHERDGVLKFVNHPQTLANSLVGFFKEEYSWAISKGAHAGLLSTKGKPIRKWLEWGAWADQEIPLPGRKKSCHILELLDEYNQHGRIRVAVVQSTEAAEDMMCRLEEEEAPPKQTTTELRQREEEIETHLSPDDIIHPEEKKPEKGTVMSKLKAAVARLKRGIPDPIVDESYAGF